jgi:hypothetical protein
MAITASTCVLLLALTTLIHYEVLRGLTAALPRFRIPGRAKLVAVILSAFAAHAAEVGLYAIAIYVLIHQFQLGTLGSDGAASFSAMVYFSAETYTSLGYGDIVPTGHLRLLAGFEALNGLLLIGWSASYTYIAMQRFWDTDGRGRAATTTKDRRDGDALDC